ncbi:MAG TPA: SH3 domain-containing protein [Gemmatimonadales bacterium]|nr:SH3 domain-containing protein [Gemmatimonadales bacterium]
MLTMGMCALWAQVSDAQAPEILRTAPIDPRAGVNFHALATPDTVWVGQQVHYQVGVFMDEDVRSRLRRNPEFMPPELRAMLAYDLPTYQSFIARPGSPGARLETYVFRRALFPLQAGRYEIPSATLAYSLPLSRSFFSREESFTRRTRPVVVYARALPTADQPADFDGAVGRLRVQTVVDTLPPRVGDPLLVTVRVRGEGNVNLLPRPRLAIPWGTVTPTRERVEVDAGGAVIRGVKEFDWLVTPRDDGIQEVPAVRYPYFDPHDAIYRVSVADPVRVEVRPGTLANAAEGEDPEAPPMTIRTAWRGALPLDPVQHPAYWWLALAAPLPALGVLAMRARPRRSPPAPAPGESLRMLASSLRPSQASGGQGSGNESPVMLARRVRRLVMLTLADRLDIARLALVRPNELAWLLRRVGVSASTATTCEQSLLELDKLAYSADGSDVSLNDAHDLVRRVSAAVMAVDAEASHRSLARRALRSRGAVAGLLIGASLLLSAQVGALANDRAATLFEAGVAAYANGDAVSAKAAFRNAARAEPRAADAWANYGTSSWTAGDTAGAVVGWQRALRLEPRAAELRPRLASVPGTAVSDFSNVPSIPAAPLQWIALAAWVLVAVAAAVALVRRARVWRPLVAGAFSVAVVAAAGALWLYRATDASQLAVVVSAGSTRSAPALIAEPGMSVVAGEIVKVESRNGVWSRVRMDRGTGGWIEASQLIPLHD